MAVIMDAHLANFVSAIYRSQIHLARSLCHGLIIFDITIEITTMGFPSVDKSKKQSQPKKKINKKKKSNPKFKVYKKKNHAKNSEDSVIKALEEKYAQVSKNEFSLNQLVAISVHCTVPMDC